MTKQSWNSEFQKTVSMWVDRLLMLSLSQMHRAGLYLSSPCRYIRENFSTIWGGLSHGSDTKILLHVYIDLITVGHCLFCWEKSAKKKIFLSKSGLTLWPLTSTWHFLFPKFVLSFSKNAETKMMIFSTFPFHSSSLVGLSVSLTAVVEIYLSSIDFSIFMCFLVCPVVQWLVQRFRSERLRVRSRRSATFTPSAHARKQSLPVWPPTLNKIPLPLPLPFSTTSWWWRVKSAEDDGILITAVKPILRSSWEEKWKRKAQQKQIPSAPYFSERKWP